jgi:hypothetical protein
MDIHAPDDRQEEGQELGIGMRVVAGIEEVLPVVRGHRPVVVLAGAVDPREWLLVDEHHQVVLRGEPPHRAHHDHVVVRPDRCRLVHRRHLELARSDLVVTGLRRDAEAPQLAIEIHHERQDPLADRAEVLVLELLALGRRSAEQGPAGEEKEVLLLGADVREDLAGAVVAEPAQDPERLLAEGGL